MKILWDLADPKNDDGVEFSYEGETKFSAVYKFVAKNNIRTLDQLWNMLELHTPTLPNGVQNVDRLAEYGAIFAAAGAAPDTLGMTIGQAVGNQWKAGDPIPKFTWDVPLAQLNPAGVDPNLLQRFRILIFDAVGGNYTRIYDSSQLPSSSFIVSSNHFSWVPSQNDWQQISTSGAATKWWVVLGGDHHSKTYYVPLPSGVPPQKYDDVIDTGFYWSDKASFTVSP